MIDVKQFVIHKRINDRYSAQLFKWYELGLLGLGKYSRPYLTFDKYFEGSPWSTMDAEIKNVLQARRNVQATVIPGHGCLIPTWVNDKKWLTHFILYAEHYMSKEQLDKFQGRADFTDYIYRNFAQPDWSDRLLVSMNLDNAHSWASKHTNGTIYPEFEQRTPVFVKWIREALKPVFKDIGRIIVFSNLKGVPVGIHRDFYFNPEGMKLHSMNFQFGQTDRPFFLFDEKTKSKVYVKGMRSYTFNDVDMHGVDAEDYDAYTVRVDGIYTDEFCKEQGFVDGLTWGAYSHSYSKLGSIKVYEPNFND